MKKNPAHKLNKNFMLETDSNKTKTQDINRRRRKCLNPVIRYIIIASLGTVLAGVVTYGLKKMGY